MSVNSPTANSPTTRREARKAELLDTWTSGKRGQMSVLSKFYKIAPAGEGLSPGKSVIDVLVEEEFGPLPGEEAGQEENGEPASELGGD